MGTEMLTRATFKRLFSQSLSSQAFNLLGVLAGAILATLSVYTSLNPWILVLVPPLLTVRGNVGGILCGRLSTSLYLGLVKPTLRKNTSYYYATMASTFVMSFIFSIVIGAFSFLVVNATQGGQLSLTDSLFLSTIAMMICTTLTLFITSSVAVVSYRRGVNPEVILYPILSTMNDIMMCATYTLLVVAYMSWSWGFAALSLTLFPVFAATTVYLTLKYWREEAFRETFKEGFPVALLLTFLSQITGSFLSQLEDQISAYPQILAIYPLLIDGTGDVGVIISSSTTARLALGYMEPQMSSIKREEGRKVALSSLTAGLTMMLGATLAASITYTPSILQVARSFSVIACAELLIAAPVIVLASFGLTILTFRRGINPDNVTIPIITSFADMLVTISIFLTSRIL
ncbi:MAG: magnesium transporter [Candidatus Freyarchaeota archaeon]|nr:magnesium transporter [Candidatus Jordarchaeia archaeon]